MEVKNDVCLITMCYVRKYVFPELFPLFKGPARALEEQNRFRKNAPFFLHIFLEEITFLASRQRCLMVLMFS